MFGWPILYTTWGLLGIVATLVVKYWLKKRNATHYWKDKNIPSVTPLPIVGNNFNLLRGKTFFQLDYERYKRLGRVFGGYEGPNPMIFVGDPELVRDVMVKDFNHFEDRREFASGDPLVLKMLTALCGDDWKRVRSVMTPAFSTGKLKKMVHLINECADDISKNFLRAADSGENCEVKRIFGTFGMDAISSTVFGSKLQNADDPNNKFIQEVLKISSHGFQWRFFFINSFPKFSKFLGIKPIDPGGLKFFAEVTEAVIAKRRKDNVYRDDMIQMMLEAQKRSEKGELNFGTDVTTDAGEEFAENYFQQYLKTKTISEREFVANCVLFFIAGYDSTSTTMGMLSYYMALNPEYQDKLLQEVDRIWKKYPTLNYEATTETKYLDAVIAETLRIAPPGARVERQCTKEYVLGNTGITIPKGMVVAFPAYCMHRDPDFFPDPETFDPQRFLDENKANIQPYMYLPFGLGPRHCIGMRLVSVLIKVGLLNILRKFAFKPCNETDVPVKFVSGGFNFQPKRICLNVVKRQL